MWHVKKYAACNNTVFVLSSELDFIGWDDHYAVVKVLLQPFWERNFVHSLHVIISIPLVENVMENSWVFRYGQLQTERKC